MPLKTQGWVGLLTRQAILRSPLKHDRISADTISRLNDAISTLPDEVQERITLMREGDTLARLGVQYTSIMEELTGDVMVGGEPDYTLDDIEELIAEYNSTHRATP